MTREQLCKVLLLSDSTIRTNFIRTKETLIDRGILIIKEGYGKNAEYYIEEYFEGAVRKYRSDKLRRKRR